MGKCDKQAIKDNQLCADELRRSWLQHFLTVQSDNASMWCAVTMRYMYHTLCGQALSWCEAWQRGRKQSTDALDAKLAIR